MVQDVKIETSSEEGPEGPRVDGKTVVRGGSVVSLSKNFTFDLV